eukprot:m.271178 g.271178  ORF g.271178 m.271178 type:complete len:192 (-) comp15683_c0_seq4:1500-2075(-)
MAQSVGLQSPLTGARCDICHLQVADFDNPLLQCVSCQQQVHQDCYGIALVSTTWYCDACQAMPFGKTSKQACALCPNTFGVTKACSDGSNYVHVICALLANCDFLLAKNGDKRGKPVLPSPRPMHPDQPCVICQHSAERKQNASLGHTFPCAYKDCSAYFHASWSVIAIATSFKLVHTRDIYTNLSSICLT